MATHINHINANKQYRRQQQVIVSVEFHTQVSQMSNMYYVTHQIFYSHLLPFKI